MEAGQYTALASAHTDVFCHAHLQVMAFKVTLKTPEGESTIECPGEGPTLCALEAAGKL
jgi:hypothetical protein